MLDVRHAPLPAIVHWGDDLGELSDAELGHRHSPRSQRVSGGLDAGTSRSSRRSRADGSARRPRRTPRGRPDFDGLKAVELQADAASATILARDDAARLEAAVELEVTDSGLFRQRITLRNLGAEPYSVARSPTFPVPSAADELLDDRAAPRERSPQRHDFTIGTHVRESRRGRPGADASLLLAAGRRGFGFERGVVHAIHGAGAATTPAAERTPTGEAFLAAGELLAPGCVSPRARRTRRRGRSARGATA